MTYAYHRIRLDSQTTRDEHRLLMEKHLGRRLNRNEVVHHINEDRRDNRLENLRVMSLGEHARLHFDDERMSTAKLDEASVRAVLHLLDERVAEWRVGQMFGVSRRCIRDIKHGRTWKHIERNSAGGTREKGGAVVVRGSGEAAADDGGRGDMGTPAPYRGGGDEATDRDGIVLHRGGDGVHGHVAHGDLWGSGERRA